MEVGDISFQLGKIISYGNKKYSIGNIVNDILIVLYGDRWYIDLW